MVGLLVASVRIDRGIVTLYIALHYKKVTTVPTSCFFYEVEGVSEVFLGFIERMVVI